MDTFWGRKEEINQIVSKIEAFGQADYLSQENVVAYWGISGIGKSTLIDQVVDKIQAEPELEYIPIIRIDCTGIGKELALLYDRIYVEVKKISDEESFTTYLKCRKKNNEAAMIKEVSAAVLEGEMLPDLIEAIILGILGPAQTILTKAARYGFAGVVEKRNRDKEKDQSRTVEEELTGAIIEDFKSNDNQKFIIILDAIECLEGVSERDFDWLWGEKGLTKSVKNVFWILTGQDQNSYATELKPLAKEEYIDTFKCRFPENNREEFSNKVVEISKGIPYILKLMLDTMNDGHNLELFFNLDGSQECNTVLLRCYTRYDNQSLKILGILASLNKWTDELVEYVILQLRYYDLLKWNIENDYYTKYLNLKKLPFIRKNVNDYNIYVEVVDFYGKILNDIDKSEIALFSLKYVNQNIDYLKKKLDSKSIINDYLFVWLSSIYELSIEEKKKEQLIVSTISSIYQLIGSDINYESASKWRNESYKAMSYTMQLDKPIFDEKILRFLLFEADRSLFTDEVQLIYQIQAKMYEQNGNKVYEKVKILKSLSVCARMKKSIGNSCTIPYDMEKYIGSYDDDVICNELIKSFKDMEASYTKIDMMAECLAEYEYKYERNDEKVGEFLECLFSAIDGVMRKEIVAPNNVIRLIYLFESFNLLQYHKSDVCKDKIDSLYQELVKVDELVPNAMKGEYYYQIALYQFNNRIGDGGYQNFQYSISNNVLNTHHRMWAERSCANYLIEKNLLLQEETELLYKRLTYILDHSEELSGITTISYYIIYTGLLIATNSVEEDYSKDIKLIIHNSSMLYGIKDVKPKSFIFFFNQITDYIYSKMHDDRLCLKWIDIALDWYRSCTKNYEIYSAMLQNLLLKVKLQTHLKDKQGITQTIDELNAVAHTAKAVDKRLDASVKEIFKKIKELEKSV